MEKEQRTYTISEVSKSLKAQTGKLKEWEESFPQLLTVQRSKSGARLYGNKEIDALRKIKLLKDKNMAEVDILFILQANNTEGVKEEKNNVVLDNQKDYGTLLSLQHDTIESLHHLTDSVSTIKEELVHEVKEGIKTEISIGHNKTKTLIQSYSHMIAETTENTEEEIKQLRQDIHREEEEKLFIQHKLEEREAQFREFVSYYRETAAAKEKNRFLNWLQLFRSKKESSADFS
ncbi:MerR family transcriptional regulator [Halalkalibacter akibai]|uniref:HTH merR-type domain-containing protein n=1 Tax=Halalkalibacter akibai (strain ATCC 43226 / DSM 21942 / CIP 109018 / JCM 9157 / 1139) TaxID=1236973 RepID=W4QYV8_HALA3|nr:MerR family transcriptional regulator [Halalkalibacter akibai]GAE37087.1 hypothetical protein JCM9157_4333 [Halalkalibacter akibai JCM 9157]